MAYRHYNAKSMLIYATVILLAYTLTLFVSVGWGTYLIGLPAYLIVGLTCIGRANHLTEDDPVSDVRRFGFAVMAGVVFLLILEPIFGNFPNWIRVYTMWSLSAIWMTTQGLPPWWELVTGQWRDETAGNKARLFVKQLHGGKKNEG